MKRRRRVAVIHWFPVEYYPPAMNLLRYLADDEQLDVRGFSCHNTRGRKEFSHGGLKISRCHFPDKGVSRWRRLWRYGWFQVSHFLRLLIWRPTDVVYIEPHSALPAFLYCWLHRRAGLYNHSHEYHEPQEYLQRGMRMVRLNHWFEQRWLFRHADWISHTNSDRIGLFLQDHPSVDAEKLQELPNMPPACWSRAENIAWRDPGEGPLRLVYVGSLSLRDTFVREIVEWVQQQPGVDLDIYCYNSDAETAAYLKSVQDETIRFFSGGVDYDELPDLLTHYHVGLILYRGMTQNYVFNASNKLFEYLAVGLDVWYPQQMLGVKPYRTDAHLPRVIELDFERLSDVDFQHLSYRDSQLKRKRYPSCEDAFDALRVAITDGAREN